MSVVVKKLADLAEIDRFEHSIQAFKAGQQDVEHMTAVRLQHGVYGQRQPGVHMFRIKVPGGRLTPDQLDAVADVAATYSQKGIAHFTTRHSIQIYYIPLDSTPAAMRRIAAADMTTREACSNTVRNMTACSLSGVCPRERVDVTRHLDAATLHFLRNPLNQQLPRKFKFSFSACETDCAQSLLHDCGVVATQRDGVNGFTIKAGGGLGHTPREAIVVEEFIPESDLLFALEALVALHSKYSDRSKRAKSRIKFLVERFGEQGFIEKYRAEFLRTRQALAGQAYPQGEWREPELWLNEELPGLPGPGAPRKLYAQRQPGLFVLPLALQTGDITPPQLRGIAALMRLHGLGDIRDTQDQNLALLNVPADAVAAMRAGLAALGLHEPVAGDDVVACPGTSTCRLGITASTLLAPQLSGGCTDLRIRVSGCHNGCAQPETGDIGIYGEGKRLHGKLVPHYQMYFSGSGMQGGALALKGPALPAARIKQAIERVAKAHLDSANPSFFAWGRAQSEGYFKELLADLIMVKAEDVQSVTRDCGDAADFRVTNLGGGECAGVTQALIGSQFFEAAHEREYRNALVFQRKFEEAGHCNEAILRLLGSGVAQLLGESPLNDLQQIAVQLAERVPGALAIEFAILAERLRQSTEVSVEEIAEIGAAVDRWTLDAAAFALSQDAQLDLAEALPL